MSARRRFELADLMREAISMHSEAISDQGWCEI